MLLIRHTLYRSFYLRFHQEGVLILNPEGKNYWITINWILISHRKTFQNSFLATPLFGHDHSKKRYKFFKLQINNNKRTHVDPRRCPELPFSLAPLCPFRGTLYKICVYLLALVWHWYRHRISKKKPKTIETLDGT